MRNVIIKVFKMLLNLPSPDPHFCHGQEQWDGRVWE